ncbi:hypothetical protein AB2N08_20655 [Massilia aurea]|uniref:hypothetical protein n=1 Tax=Massilia aurea TaxID=373040 RepID=UPI003462248C
MGLSFSALAADGETTQVFYSNGQLEYIGSVDSGANQRLFALYETLATKPTTLSIRSLGGDVNPGMELGAWVHAHKLNVKVMEFCFSSCANYVFPAAVKKTVSNFAMVGYHGGPGGPLKIELDDALSAAERQAFMDDIEKLRARNGRHEAEYFKKIGVRTDLSTLGQGDQYKPYYDQHPEAQGWTYSLDDFARLGVRDINVINPPWKPGTASRQTVVVTIPIDLKAAPAP